MWKSKPGWWSQEWRVASSCDTEATWELQRHHRVCETFAVTLWLNASSPSFTDGETEVWAGEEGGQTFTCWWVKNQPHLLWLQSLQLNDPLSRFQNLTGKLLGSKEKSSSVTVSIQHSIYQAIIQIILTLTRAFIQTQSTRATLPTCTLSNPEEGQQSHGTSFKCQKILSLKPITLYLCFCQFLALIVLFSRRWGALVTNLAASLKQCPKLCMS